MTVSHNASAVVFPVPPCLSRDNFQIIVGIQSMKFTSETWKTLEVVELQYWSRLMIYSTAEPLVLRAGRAALWEM